MANTYVQLASLAAVKSFGTAAGSDVVVPDDVVAVLLQAETQNVRFTHDGTTPTATYGLLLVAGSAPMRFSGKNFIRNLKVIEATASGKLNVGLLVS